MPTYMRLSWWEKLYLHIEGRRKKPRWDWWCQICHDFTSIKVQTVTTRVASHFMDEANIQFIYTGPTSFGCCTSKGGSRIEQIQFCVYLKNDLRVIYTHQRSSCCKCQAESRDGNKHRGFSTWRIFYFQLFRRDERKKSREKTKEICNKFLHFSPVSWNFSVFPLSRHRRRLSSLIHLHTLSVLTKAVARKFSFDARSRRDERRGWIVAQPGIIIQRKENKLVSRVMAFCMLFHSRIWIIFRQKT